MTDVSVEALESEAQAIRDAGGTGSPSGARDSGVYRSFVRGADYRMEHEVDHG